MKKYNILFSLIILLATTAYSQVKVGANILPGISTNRISSDSDTISFSNDGVGYKIALERITISVLEFIGSQKE